MIVLNDYRKYPQAHGSIVVAFHPEVFWVSLAFHPEVFRVSLFIFSQRRARYTNSSIGINMIS